mmetsp:Transcript_107186/g.320562  ORF Transcript_107186/g.320562 Transcript_107186/m.320562 type:complete len:223 (-) Transcript_107186:201-869(-)
MLLQKLEEGRHGQHVVLEHVQALEEVQHPRLPPARAVHHAVDAVPQAALEDPAQHRRVGPRRGQEQLADRELLALDLDELLQAQVAAVDSLVGPPGVEGLREVCHEGLGEDVVPRARQACAADAAVVGGLVGGLPRGGKAHDDVAVADPRVVDDLRTRKPRRGCRVHRQRPHEVPHVCSVRRQCRGPHAVAPEFRNQLLAASGHLGEDLVWNHARVPADGGR